MLILATVLFIAADVSAMIFTYSDEMSGLHDSMTEFIRISCTFLPFIGFGVLTSSLFQALGMGTKALISTVFRNFIILPPAFIIGMSGTLTDIWWAVAIMEIIGPIVMIIWCLSILKAMISRTVPKQ